MSRAHDVDETHVDTTTESQRSKVVKYMHTDTRRGIRHCSVSREAVRDEAHIRSCKSGAAAGRWEQLSHETQRKASRFKWMTSQQDLACVRSGTRVCRHKCVGTTPLRCRLARGSLPLHASALASTPRKWRGCPRASSAWLRRRWAQAGFRSRADADSADLARLSAALPRKALRALPKATRHASGTGPTARASRAEWMRDASKFELETCGLRRRDALWRHGTQRRPRRLQVCNEAARGVREVPWHRGVGEQPAGAASHEGGAERLTTLQVYGQARRAPAGPLLRLQRVLTPLEDDLLATAEVRDRLRPARTHHRPPRQAGVGGRGGREAGGRGRASAARVGTRGLYDEPCERGMLGGVRAQATWRAHARGVKGAGDASRSPFRARPSRRDAARTGFRARR